jgi:S-(hydroxymethyl)glutathione dehydrogenase/alcohol dehydrogenase
MRALRIHGSKHVSVDQVPDPKIQSPRDVILKVTATAICGSDLHIYNGFIPQPRPMVLGHEFMGIVEEVGSAISNLKRGDRVVVPFPIACGHCFFCERKLPGHCENSNPKNYGPEGGMATQKGGGLFGYTDLYGGYDGGQAEYVRVPYADVGPRLVPDNLTDEQVLFLTDICPTGYAAIEWANLKGGETVAVFGAGPVGIMALKAARLRGAKTVISVDREEYRLAKAKELTGAEIFNFEKVDAVEAIRSLTGGRGADVVVDAVGMEAHRSTLKKVTGALTGEAGSTAALELCLSAVRRGGIVSILGVYGSNYGFPVGQMFDKGIEIKCGQAPAHALIDRLLKHVEAGELVLDDVISHRMPLAEAPKAYQIFCDKKDNCVKVVLTP